MILLDTNVISEIMLPVPSPLVIAWVNAQERSSLYTSEIVRAEILSGVGLLPDGKRKVRLATAVAAFFDDDMTGKILPFDQSCSEAYEDVAVSRRRRGLALGQFDGLIAATAKAHGATLATRNLADFDDLDLDLVNPWENPS